jgi:glycerol dehydrogenase-like iron-containing ADH family enzyme
VVDLSKNNNIKSNSLKKVVIYYGDFSYKNYATDFVNSLKKELKNVNPNIVQINKKFRVEALTITSLEEFDIFLDKITNTKFENYNISLK